MYKKNGSVNVSNRTPTRTLSLKKNVTQMPSCHLVLTYFTSFQETFSVRWSVLVYLITPKLSNPRPSSFTEWFGMRYCLPCRVLVTPGVSKDWISRWKKLQQNNTCPPTGRTESSYN